MQNAAFFEENAMNNIPDSINGSSAFRVWSPWIVRKCGHWIVLYLYVEGSISSESYVRRETTISSFR